IRYGSSTSSIVSASSPIACARFSRPTGPPANFSITARRSFLSITSRPSTSTSSILSAASATSREIAPAAQQAVRDARRAARAPGDLESSLGGDFHLEEPRGAVDDLLQLGLGVELKRSEEHTSELQSPYDLVCRLL